MISINKTFFYIFVFCLISLIPSICLVKFLDELCALLMACLMGLDLLVNKRVKRYLPMLYLILIMGLYAIYSILFLNNNTITAILYDFVIQLKPFIPLLFVYAISPTFTPRMKKVIKDLCIANSIVLLLSFAGGSTTISSIIFHVAYLGTTAFVCFLIYIYFSIDEYGKVSKKDMIIGFAILIIGLTSTRAKFYGEFVLVLYFFFFYKPGIMKKVKLKQILLGLFAIVAMFVVSWNKIEYYFIVGNGDSFDPDVLESFARPALYIGMWSILLIYPILGSGLASYASFASTTYVNYANTYYEIGLDKIWGLSEDFPEFICDAFFPELAQFGIVGIILFVLFWRWIYKNLVYLLHVDVEKYKLPFIIGSLCIIFLIIESVAGTMFVQTSGMVIMLLLGLIISESKRIKLDNETNNKILNINDNGQN